MSAAADMLRKTIGLGPSTPLASAPEENVIEFTQPPEMRLQDIVASALTKGMTWAEIAEMTGKSEEVIKKIGHSEVVRRALAEYAQQAGDESTIQQMLTAQSVDAVLELGKILRESESSHLRLRAIELTLAYTLPKASERLTLSKKSKNNLAGLGNNEKAAEELKKLDEEIEREKKRISA